MPIPITMPRLSDTMEEGTLVKWHVKVGDQVKADQHVADVETDKATMELQVYDDGTVAKLAVQEGEAAKVGKLIMMLAGEGESVEEAAKAAEGGDEGGASAKPSAAPLPGGGEKANEQRRARAAAEGEEAPQARAAADTRGRSPADVKRQAATARGGEAPPPQEEEAGDLDESREARGAGTAPATRPGGAVAVAESRLRVSPLAAKIAADRGIDLAQVKGSGPEGRIIKRDILGFKPGPAAREGAKPPATAAPAGPRIEPKTVPVSNMRKTIARRLVESKTTIPHFTVTLWVNMDPLMSLRETLNKQLETQGVKLSVNDFVVRACAIALAQHPMVNASWSDQGIQQHGSINVGVAVALPQDKGGGLVVPVLRDAQHKGLRAVSAETKALAEKAKTRGLSVEEMSEGTFTISNLGPWGVDHFEAIINPPQAAILAVGAAIKKPVARHGQLAIGTEMACTLSADHRVIDGAMAAEFLATLKGVLENPAVLLV